MMIRLTTERRHPLKQLHGFLWQRTNRSTSNQSGKRNNIRLDSSLKHFLKHLLCLFKILNFFKKLKQHIVKNNKSFPFNLLVEVIKSKHCNIRVCYVTENVLCITFCNTVSQTLENFRNLLLIKIRRLEFGER
ncbi:hypothetical protein KIW84_014757 [Lathyrus oleraceus]|uniref:Uncharacterized protein n=1 Tax=Pisum sativum TaxID=3888 RepID=A0A9D5GZH5_PEA|nr:hypothetical protein KIW84_014757 [Pisum sativum]